jgi:hypothetical protein
MEEGRFQLREYRAIKCGVNQGIHQNVVWTGNMRICADRRDENREETSFESLFDPPMAVLGRSVEF